MKFHDIKVKCESYEKHDMIVYDIPTVNKFSPLVNLESDKSEMKDTVLNVLQ